jgi:sporulation protein YlmC with PRC-barrel domain
VTQLSMACPVRCSDEPIGELSDVVIDPITRRVTHLVIQPHHKHRLARLVPIGLVVPADDGHPGELELACTSDELRRLEPVQEFAYLRLDEHPVEDPDWDVGIETVLALPHYDGSGLLDALTVADPYVAVNYDRVPKGEVEIRRASIVTSADGHELGHVDGFLIDAEDNVTHLVLRRGHLWGRREITIPIGAVARVETDGVTIALSREQIAALPAVPVRRWPGER